MTDLTPASGFDHDDVLLAIARGERYALRALYQQESRWMLGVAMKLLRDRQAAEDVLHDAFVQIWRAAGTFDPARGSGRGWLYTVVRHRALETLRKDARMTTLASEDIEALSDRVQAAAPADAPDPFAADGADLERCLDALDERKRECIVGAFVHGLTHEQLARTLGAPLGTVKSWVRRGLLALRECLS
ncbi:MAG: sigma-70 family RNA polymerase sigma factor [Lautropia sp.]